jgi:hypothetical protein
MTGATGDPAGPRFSATSARAIEAALRDDPDANGSALLTALKDACAEAHANRLSAGHVLLAFRSIWNKAGPPRGVSEEEWARRYTTMLDLCLAEYFSLVGSAR